MNLISAFCPFCGQFCRAKLLLERARYDVFFRGVQAIVWQVGKWVKKGFANMAAGKGAEIAGIAVGIHACLAAQIRVFLDFVAFINVGK